LLELVSSSNLQLVIAAVGWPLVRAPSLKDGGMSKAIALHVIVFDLADALDAQRLPREILAGAPSALPPGHPRGVVPSLCVGPLAPGMALQGVFAEWRELDRELSASRHGERRGDADVMQPLPIVIQPEQQRAHQLVLSRLVPAKARDDAIGRAGVLDLDHRALARFVYPAGRFRDHAVKPPAPAPCQ